MTVRELIARLDDLDGEQTIYAAGGHLATPGDEAVAALEPQDGSLPIAAKGLAYLLEVEEARTAVQVWREWRDGLEPSPDEACEAVLHYARHDAYLPV